MGVGGLITRWCSCGDRDGGKDSETLYGDVDVACSLNGKDSM